mmetsp:Transcript_130608/g.227073  ORF Transcript_130608/g.227073 Transcript_130608/m.227073 type:complete len:356 (-) Transcript_130608:2129-3196(-)
MAKVKRSASQTASPGTAGHCATSVSCSFEPTLTTTNTSLLPGLVETRLKPWMTRTESSPLTVGRGSCSAALGAREDRLRAGTSGSLAALCEAAPMSSSRTALVAASLASTQATASCTLLDKSFIEACSVCSSERKPATTLSLLSTRARASVIRDSKSAPMDVRKMLSSCFMSAEDSLTLVLSRKACSARAVTSFKRSFTPMLSCRARSVCARALSVCALTSSRRLRTPVLSLKARSVFAVISDKRSSSSARNLARSSEVFLPERSSLHSKDNLSSLLLTEPIVSSSCICNAAAASSARSSFCTTRFKASDTEFTKSSPTALPSDWAVVACSNFCWAPRSAPSRPSRSTSRPLWSA